MGRRRDIRRRYDERHEAEHYRDRFKTGRRRNTHAREVAGLRSALQQLGRVDTILDVGSGPGRFIPTLSEFARRVIQADFSRNMLDVSRDSEPLPDGRGGYVQADACELPFKPRTFDLAFCHRLINHIGDCAMRRRMLGELCRVTRQGVLISCLGPPAPVRAVRELWRSLSGRSSSHAQVSLDEILADASASELTLSVSTPFNSMLQSAVFLMFRPATSKPRP